MKKDKDWEKEYEGLFEQAVRNCLRQVKGEITEEQRVRENDILNSKGLEIIKKQLTKAKEEGRREGVEGLIQWLMEDKEYTLKMYRDPYETMSICAEGYLKSLEVKE